MPARRRLVIDGCGEPYEIVTTPVQIGRDPDCDIHLPSPRVSRLHAWILPAAGGRLAIQDARPESLGIRVDGQRQIQHMLRSGCEIWIGDTRLSYHEEAEEDLTRGGNRRARDDAATERTTGVTARPPFGTGPGGAEHPYLVGMSPAIKRLRREAAAVAASGMPVLITGETGVGKELVASLIHEWSARRERAFVPINCAAIPESLIESNLFGHVKGAFSGATEDREGPLETAHGGTAFLDEIGDLSLPAQAKILRFLENGEVQKVGRARPLRVDVRVVSATNKDLPTEVAAGSFRADLWYRLKLATLTVPPLRDRPDDIPLLAHCFLARSLEAYAIGSNAGMAAEAMDRLVAYRWPGNVRELKGVIALAACVRQGGEIRAGDLRLEADPTGIVPPGDVPPRASSEEDVLNWHYRRVLELHRGNVIQTAATLGVAQGTVRKRIKDNRWEKLLAEFRDRHAAGERGPAR